MSVTRHAKGWRARVRYRDWSGVVHEAARFDTTRQGARQRLAEAMDSTLLELRSDAPVTSSTTMAELAELWLRELAYAPLAASSRRAYRSLTNKHVLAQGALCGLSRWAR